MIASTNFFSFAIFFSSQYSVLRLAARSLPAGCPRGFLSARSFAHLAESLFETRSGACVKRLWEKQKAPCQYLLTRGQFSNRRCHPLFQTSSAFSLFPLTPDPTSTFMDCSKAGSALRAYILSPAGYSLKCRLHVLFFFFADCPERNIPKSGIGVNCTPNTKSCQSPLSKSSRPALKRVQSNRTASARRTWRSSFPAN